MNRPLYAMVRDAVAGRGPEHSKQSAVTELCKSFGVSLTQALRERDRSTKTRLIRALTGSRYDDATGSEFKSAPAVLPVVALRSTLKRCKSCDKAKKDEPTECGLRPGAFHSITYKTGLIPGNAKELHDVQLQDGTINEYALCEVNPETGEFLHPVPIVEAMKILTQYGHGIVHPRQKHRGVVVEIAPEVDENEPDNTRQRLVKATAI